MTIPHRERRYESAAQRRVEQKRCLFCRYPTASAVRLTGCWVCLRETITTGPVSIAALGVRADPLLRGTPDYQIEKPISDQEPPPSQTNRFGENRPREGSAYDFASTMWSKPGL